MFQNDVRIYFLMNFVKGGELFKQIIDHKRFPEERARFYGAQVALALGHLHSQKILYRDLKPENILIGDDGYLFLADFGLSRMINRGEVALSFCGTAEYLAPEMIDGTGHHHGIDWWALGILIYEMLVGIPPFYHKVRDHMFMLIKQATVKYPDPDKHGICVSPVAQDIINKLLDKDMHTRLGSHGYANEVLAHPFFAGINTDELLDKR